MLLTLTYRAAFTAKNDIIHISIMMKNGIIKGNCLPSVVVVALVAVLMSILAKGGDVELDDLLLNITH